MQKTSDNSVTKAEVAARMAKELKDSDPVYKLPRHERRKEKSRAKLWQDQFNKVAHSYILEVVEKNVPNDSEEALAIFNKWDQRWRVFARNQISRNKDLFTTSEKRSSLTNHFLTFVDKYNENNKKPIAEITEKVENKDDLINEIQLLLKENGINTQARTKAGLQKVINSKLDVNSPAYIEINRIINSVL